MLEEEDILPRLLAPKSIHGARCSEKIREWLVEKIVEDRLPTSYQFFCHPPTPYWDFCTYTGKDSSHDDDKSLVGIINVFTPPVLHT